RRPKSSGDARAITQAARRVQKPAKSRMCDHLGLYSYRRSISAIAALLCRRTTPVTCRRGSVGYTSRKAYMPPPVRCSAWFGRLSSGRFVLRRTVPRTRPVLPRSWLPRRHLRFLYFNLVILTAAELGRLLPVDVGL